MAASAQFVAAACAELSPLDVWSKSFRDHPTIIIFAGELRGTAAEHAAISRMHAAGFLLKLLLEAPPSARWRNLQQHGYGKWIAANARKLRLSTAALGKIRGAFRVGPGERVYDVYLNRPELQQIYPLGLLSFGQAHFISWLNTHGRTDFGLTSEEILWFLFQSASEVERGLTLTYLIRPNWQEEFPLALTSRGWRPFVRALRRAYGKYFPPRRLRKPAVLSRADEEVMRAQVRGSPARALEGANVMSHFCNPSGIQQAALWTKTGLERGGLRTSCRDIPVPRHTIPTDRAEWLGLEIHPVTILTNAATPYFLNAYERAGLFRRPDVYRVAYWAWELERVPDEWVGAARCVNEIWCPTPFVVDAMRAVMPVPVHHMLPGVEVGPIEAVDREEFGIARDRFVFLFMFDLHSQIHRKNPGGVVAAFRQAFRPDEAATLVIKASGGDFFPNDLEALQRICRAENVLLIHDVMSRARAYGLLAMCDCFVSLHRSEGFGLGLAEAMLLGKPVIGTGYSGNLAFMNAENSLLVDYKIVEIEEDRPVYTKGNRWAEPSVEHAAQHMRYVFDRREEAFARARAVQPDVAQLLSLEAAGKRMRTRLEQIIRERSPC